MRKSTISISTLMIFTITITFILSCATSNSIGDPSPTNPIIADTDNHEVRIAVRLNRIWCDDSLSVHNCVVYAGGIKSPKALFQAYCRHDEFYDALTDIGADPGADIGDNPDSNAVPTGSMLEVTFRWNGSPRTYSLDELVEDSLGRGFKIRMHNGKERAISTNMGCIMCYTACNISITSNTTYDWSDKMLMAYTFKPDALLLPSDSALIIIVFRISD